MSVVCFNCDGCHLEHGRKLQISDCLVSNIAPCLSRSLVDPGCCQATGEDHDTVGAVAIDAFGNVAYATSTGGITAKQTWRVGDSPIIGMNLNYG